jgi:outer membrane biosynthesis protein TonB
MLNFKLIITTKPNIVKYSTAGSVTLEGSFADIQKKLEANPKTKIPQILFTVYQHVFNSIYILASILNTPYPPPDLLHPMAEKIQILSSTPKPEPQPEQAAAPEQPSTPEKPPVETATADTGAGTQQPTSEQPSASEQAGQTPAPTTGGSAQTTSTPP